MKFSTLSGTMPVENDKLKMCVSGLEISLVIFFIILVLTSSNLNLNRSLRNIKNASAVYTPKSDFKWQRVFM